MKEKKEYKFVCPLTHIINVPLLSSFQCSPYNFTFLHWLTLPLMFLYTNKKHFIEEELKRLQQESSNDSTYNQVQFNYDAPLGPTRYENSSEFGTVESEADKVFVLPKNFDVPSSLQLPETMKQHAIIEKTARFISAQGPQMEILIKAKQSNNQQFDFLNQNNSLNSYYKFVLNALKNGAYPRPENETQDSLISDDKATNSTVNTAVEDPFSKPYIPVPAIKYTPSANCAYTQLISKIKGVPLPPPEPEKQQLSHYTPVLLQSNANNTTQVASDNLGCANDGQQHQQQTGTRLQPKNVSNALMLAHYCSSDTENDDQSDVENEEEHKEKNDVELCFPIPPDYLQNIIDKTAGYVIKNGRQFEETLRIKNDERFTFLFPNNEYYSYYMYKVTGEVKSYMPTAKDDDDKQTVPSGPVSFSIKIKEDQPVTALRPGLPQEMSDDESEKIMKSNGDNTQLGDQVQLPQQQQQQQVSARSVPEHVQKAIQLVESQLMARNAQLGIPTVQNRSRFDIDQSGTVVQKTSVPLSSLFATVAEKSSVNVVKTHQKELKRAEEKVKDKLAQIAREKLGGLISKEKQLQIERKKKAMAFLNQIKGNSNSSDGATTKISSQMSSKNKEEDESDTSSVHSIPISSYGDDKSDTETVTKPSNNNQLHGNSTIDEEDDDVQLITIETPKQNSRSRIRQRTQTPEVVIISPKRSRSRSRSPNTHKKHCKSKSHKSKKKSKHSHHNSKKKAKKRSRSHSTYRSQSCYSEDVIVEASSSSDSSSRKRRKRSCSHKKKRSRKHDR